MLDPQKVPIEVGKVPKPNLMADGCHLFIGLLQHRTGLTNAHPVDEFNKFASCLLLKISGKGGGAQI